MKKFLYFFLFIFFLPLILIANELDEELIDKKFNQIKTSEFCSTNEWNEIERKDFVKAFVLGWYWEVKEASESEKIDEQSFNKFLRSEIEIEPLSFKGSLCITKT